MKKVLLLIVFFGVGFYSCNKLAKSDAKLLSPAELQLLMQQEGVQLIDLRTPKEFQSGFIENAQNIDFLSPTFEQELLKLDKNKPLILYCRSGRRSAKSYKKWFQAGFTEIYDLEGGIVKWRNGGFLIKNTP